MKLPLIHRSVWSYAKVQHTWGDWIRNRGRQLQSARVRSLRYLDVGCGRNTHPEFINLDYLWHPAVDVCWDITRGLPFADGALDGIFSEHCLEHFPLTVGLRILRECRRVLKPGATARIVVPDAGLYLRIYQEQMSGNVSLRFPFQEREAFEDISTPILSVNRVYYYDRESLFGHRTMYDAALLGELLKKAGFGEAQKAAFQNGRDKALLIDSPERACESLYVEAW